MATIVVSDGRRHNENTGLRSPSGWLALLSQGSTVSQSSKYRNESQLTDPACVFSCCFDFVGAFNVGAFDIDFGFGFGFDSDPVRLRFFGITASSSDSETKWDGGGDFSMAGRFRLVLGFFGGING